MTIPAQNPIIGIVRKNYKVMRKHSAKGNRSAVSKATVQSPNVSEASLKSNQELAALFANADPNSFPDEVMQNIQDYRRDLEADSSAE